MYQLVSLKGLENILQRVLIEKKNQPVPLTVLLLKELNLII